MVYSMCLFNLVENEVVVVEFIKWCGGVLEIVDVFDWIFELLRRLGILIWNVMIMVEGNVVEYLKYEDS